MDLFSDSEAHSLPFVIPEDIDASYHWDKDLGVFFISLSDGELVFSEHFFDKKISDRCVEYFQENSDVDWSNTADNSTDWSKLSAPELKDINFTNIKWQQEKIKMYGKEIPLPRLTSWYGDPGKSYTYSGITSQPNRWNKGLLYIKTEIERIASKPFNSVLLNWYRNGEDYLNWHADDEKELGKNPLIASVNFGETRDFVLRRNDDKTKKMTIPLKHGTLLIMGGALQHHWQHSVPKRKSVKGSRFNLTFRQIYSEGE